MATAPRPVPVGLEVDADGAHPAAWRAADHDPARLVDPDFLAHRFRLLDEAGFGFLTLPDHSPPPDLPGGVRARLDTVETATFAAALTSRAALIPAVNTVHAEPFHLANQLSTLDRATRGRSGWLAGAIETDATAAGYGRRARTDRNAVAREARDVITAVRRLWDTWEDDVLVADTAAQRFLDLDRWHYADVVTDLFSVRGPGLLPRPVQGQLPVWSDGVPDLELFEQVDVAVVSAPTTRELVATAERLRSRGIPRVVGAVEVVLDARGTSAERRLAELDARAPWPRGDRLRMLGSAGQLTQELLELSSSLDGIRLHPAVLDVDVPVLTALVLPGLAAAGRLRVPRADGTLRDLLDLPRPTNVFTLERNDR